MYRQLLWRGGLLGHGAIRHEEGGARAAGALLEFLEGATHDLALVHELEEVAREDRHDFTLLGRAVDL